MEALIILAVVFTILYVLVRQNNRIDTFKSELDGLKKVIQDKDNLLQTKQQELFVKDSEIKQYLSKIKNLDTDYRNNLQQNKEYYENTLLNIKNELNNKIKEHQIDSLNRENIMKVNNENLIIKLKQENLIEQENLVKKYEEQLSQERIKFTQLNNESIDREKNLIKNFSDEKLKIAENYKKEIEEIKEKYLKETKENIERAFTLNFEDWKKEHEQEIREDAIKRSNAVNAGKITEHLLPFKENFPYNPRDVRFMGSPIDLLVFKGMSENIDDISIVFIEVKTGSSRLSDLQRSIKKSIEAGRVEWKEFNIDLNKTSYPSFFANNHK